MNLIRRKLRSRFCAILFPLALAAPVDAGPKGSSVSQLDQIAIPQGAASLDGPVEEQSTQESKTHFLKGWAAEGEMELSSTGEDFTPWLGAAALAPLGSVGQLGARFLLPTETSLRGSMRAEAFWRAPLPVAPGLAFLEPSFGWDRLHGISGGSFGLSIGIEHELNSGVSLGGTTGVRLQGADALPGSPKLGALAISPRLCIQASFRF